MNAQKSSKHQTQNHRNPRGIEKHKATLLQLALWVLIRAEVRSFNYTVIIIKVPLTPLDLYGFSPPSLPSLLLVRNYIPKPSCFKLTQQSSINKLVKEEGTLTNLPGLPGLNYYKS